MRYLFPLNPYNQQRQYEKPVWVFPAHLAMYSTYLRNHGHEVIWEDSQPNTLTTKKMLSAKWLMESFDSYSPQFKTIKDDFDIDVPFNDLPYPDRVFTDALHKRWQSYGNYKLHPATHMMVSNLCWYGKCSFCIDTAKLEAGEKRGCRSVDHVMLEIDDLIAKGYKEVFDDSGTFPIGKWLAEFCEKMQSRKHKITIGCNFKPIRYNYEMMANAGFRFLLVGIESANQYTVDRIKKGQCSEDVIPIIKSMADAGLEPHGTFMTGYEWETKEDENKTIRLCHFLLRKGYLKTAQASVYSPPRTKPDPSSIGHRFLPRFYDAYKHPEFWINKLRDIKQWEDFTYLVRGARLVIEEKWRKLCTR